MKYIYLAASALILVSTSAYANSSTVEGALKSREYLSSFYKALVETGVAAELESGTSYTVFAPNNDAFAKISKEKYPCIHSLECKRELADILRNHIVKGNYNMSDISRGGLPNLDHEFINVSKPNRNNYFVAGKHVESTHTLFGGMLYELKGIIASDVEMMRIELYRPKSVEPKTEEPAAEKK